MGKPTRWTIPARIVTNVEVIVEADTAKEALEKFRKRDWLESNESGGWDDYKVTKTGAVTRLP
jgi:hypothetical protein